MGRTDSAPPHLYSKGDRAGLSSVGTKVCFPHYGRTELKCLDYAIFFSHYSSSVDSSHCVGWAPLEFLVNFQLSKYFSFPWRTRFQSRELMSGWPNCDIIYLNDTHLKNSFLRVTSFINLKLSFPSTARMYLQRQILHSCLSCLLLQNFASKIKLVFSSSPVETLFLSPQLI